MYLFIIYKIILLNYLIKLFYFNPYKEFRITNQSYLGILFFYFFIFFRVRTEEKKIRKKNQ